jgi:hypothetical protein
MHGSRPVLEFVLDDHRKNWRVDCEVGNLIVYRIPETL